MSGCGFLRRLIGSRTSYKEMGSMYHLEMEDPKWFGIKCKVKEVTEFISFMTGYVFILLTNGNERLHLFHKMDDML